MSSSRKTKAIRIGNVTIGDSNPVAVQSMTKTFTHDVEATVKQIHRLEKAGCQIVRCAVKEKSDALAIAKIKEQINIPLVADIHFDYRLAVLAAEAGADKLRINPGNIGPKEKIKKVVMAAKKMRIPIRVGVNSGSLEKDIKAKYGHSSAEALVQSALRNIKLVKDMGFDDIVVSVKATGVLTTIAAYTMLSRKVNYPLHVGITEAGIPSVGIIRSAVGIGALLSSGIGDTIRVSLTEDPVEEVRVAREILKSLELETGGVVLISCPTCGRCQIDIKKIATQIEKRTRHIKEPVKIAIMGCEVNGPGEAADADVGLAGGRGVGLIFKKGEIVRRVTEPEMIDALLDEIKEVLK
ncbi:MAG: flavodoxin-dependent (E)-4-hydroxy-3-methylbut-2-enyl-diphosphate synthase [Candidatus Margulisiibacteriota bacterium]|nr:flavodoxin-dependent (E)-4-hydroxy-3-methylbut-2-enyl-diphosphate synthase [Candidatus Margulisiibacteriota bacterium]